MKYPKHINGRRGAFQLLFGIVYACLTAATILAKDFPPALVWIPKMCAQYGLTVTPAVLAAVWLIPAVAALIGAFLPRPQDRFSFSALAAAPTLYGCLYLIGGVLHPVGTSLFGVILYWALAGAVMVVSGMMGDRDKDNRETTL